MLHEAKSWPTQERTRQAPVDAYASVTTHAAREARSEVPRLRCHGRRVTASPGAALAFSVRFRGLPPRTLAAAPATCKVAATVPSPTSLTPEASPSPHVPSRRQERIVPAA